MENSSLNLEKMIYDDMVVADFIDTYDNLPFKTRSIYHFAEKFCSKNFKFFYFHDSDTILHENIESLVLEDTSDPRKVEDFKEMDILQDQERMMNETKERDPFNYYGRGWLHKGISTSEGTFS